MAIANRTGYKGFELRQKNPKLGFLIMSGQVCAKPDCWGMAQPLSLEVLKNGFHKRVRTGTVHPPRYAGGVR